MEIWRKEIAVRKTEKRRMGAQNKGKGRIGAQNK